MYWEGVPWLSDAALQGEKGFVSQRILVLLQMSSEYLIRFLIAKKGLWQYSFHCLFLAACCVQWDAKMLKASRLSEAETVHMAFITTGPLHFTWEAFLPSEPRAVLLKLALCWVIPIIQSASFLRAAWIELPSGPLPIHLWGLYQPRARASAVLTCPEPR